ncbi:universal stress protein [Streptomyces sp. NPDC097981]|uniref:universal stress protein n=1 Tax=Streptomyces sp. NPDC097981 TaxID=3155428 RepID=UPI003332355C
MSHSVVVGIDGSAQSRAAAEWAATEACRSGRRLRLVHVGAAENGTRAQPESAEDCLPPSVLSVRDRIAAALPGLELSCVRMGGSPPYALAAAGEREGLLVLGSRGLGGFTGMLVGSVGLHVAAHALCPVVLVRADPDGGAGAAGDVVVGVDGDRLGDEVLAFAFEQAACRGATLRAVESRALPTGPYVTRAPLDQCEIRDSLAEAELVRLQDALACWHDKFPEVRVETEITAHPAGRALVEASRAASLVVVGRRTPALRAAVHRLGTVAHAVLHHAHSPVAVVPHD